MLDEVEELDELESEVLFDSLPLLFVSELFDSAELDDDSADDDTFSEDPELVRASLR
ncbi:hypothetical protein GCM10023204_60090 [Actinomycetospora succinea]